MEHEHHVKEESVHTKTDEEVSIDFSKVKKLFSSQFWKGYPLVWKYVWVLLVIIPLVLSVSVRMQSADMPVTDAWAKNTVYNYYQNSVAQQVNNQYPNLPQAQRDQIIAQEFQKLLSSQGAMLDQQVRETSAYFRSTYEYEVNGTSYVYMPDIDPYHYLDLARNYLDHGDYGAGVRNGVPWNTKVLAPKGQPAGDTIYHPKVLAYTYKVMHLFNSKIDLMQGAQFFPVIFSALGVIPAFFIGRRFAGNVGGFFVALMVGVNGFALSRTLFGHADTDAYNVFFPLLIVWLFIESFEAREKWAEWVLIGLTGLALGLFSVTWGGGWWYVLDITLGTLGIYFVYLAVMAWQEKKSVQAIVHSQRLQHIIVFGVMFVVAAGIFVSWFSSFSAFIGGLFGPLGFTIIKSASHVNLWPNVYTTVAELNPASITSVISNIGGRFFFAVALLGIVLALLKRDRHGARDVKYTILLLIWFAATMYASTKGIRFVLLLVPAFSIAFGVALGFVYKYSLDFSERSLKVQKWITGSIVLLIFAVVLVPYVSSSFAAARTDVPLVNDAWWGTLENIRENSAPNAIINSWWDFGHHFKYIADRAVTFDGGSQNTPMAHWIGRVLLTSDEDEAVGILRMLDCGSNDAFDVLNKEVNDTVKSVKILYAVVKIDEESARKELAKYVKNPDAVLQFTHCSPPEDYFITSDDMVGKAGVWGHFGAWDFERARVWVELKNVPQSTAMSMMMSDWNYSRQDAEKLYFEASTLSGEDAANQWIAPWPGYLSGMASCAVKGTMVQCVNGVEVNVSSFVVSVRTQQGTAVPRVLATVNEQGEFVTVVQNDSAADVGIVLIPQRGGGYVSLAVAPELAGSMFTRLFFFDGHGLEHFKKFDERTQLDGGRISTWNLDWDGGEKNVMGALVVKAVVGNGDVVAVDYIGWTVDGGVFDSSVQGAGRANVTITTSFDDVTSVPLQFTVGTGQMIRGFDKGVLGMRVGEEKELAIPPQDAYGTDPVKHQLGNKTLHFRVRVSSIQ